MTLTSDLSRKNLEKDFERMDTPQGTFYRVYFDIYLTLDGSEFNAELVYVLIPPISPPIVHELTFGTGAKAKACSPQFPANNVDDANLF